MQVEISDMAPPINTFRSNKKPPTPFRLRASPGGALTSTVQDLFVEKKKEEVSPKKEETKEGLINGEVIGARHITYI